MRDKIVADLVQRMGNIEERIEQESSWVKRFSLYFGLLALIISIATGGYTIVKVLLIEPKEITERKITEVYDAISRLGALDREVTSAQFENNLAKASALSKIGNVERLGLLDRADELLASIKQEMGFSVYFALAHQNLNQGNNERANRYARQAVEVAKGATSKAEALRTLGTTFFSPGDQQDIQAARKAFASAISETKRTPQYIALAARLNTYATHIMSEIYFGDCDAAKQLYVAMLNDQALVTKVASELKFQQNVISQQAGGQSACRSPPNW